MGKITGLLYLTTIKKRRSKTWLLFWDYSALIERRLTELHVLFPRYMPLKLKEEKCCLVCSMRRLFFSSFRNQGCPSMAGRIKLSDPKKLWSFSPSDDLHVVKKFMRP
jgi:hypothetical protein